MCIEVDGKSLTAAAKYLFRYIVANVMNYCPGGGTICLDLCLAYALWMWTDAGSATEFLNNFQNYRKQCNMQLYDKNSELHWPFPYVELRSLD